MVISKRKSSLTFLSLLFLSLNASAHPGHLQNASFFSGLLHPLLGFDHLLTALAIGIGASPGGWRAQIFFPSTFLLAMFLGSLLGLEHFVLPLRESGIFLAMLFLGLAFVFSIRFQTVLALPVIFLFGAFHGNAHGIEIGPRFSALFYLSGIFLTTLALHVLGIWTSVQSKRNFHANSSRLARQAFGVLMILTAGWMRFF